MGTLATLGRQAGTSAIVALLNGGKMRLKLGSAIKVDIPLAAVAFDTASGVAVARGGDGATAISSINPRHGDADSVGEWDNYEFVTSADVLLYAGPKSDGYVTLTIVPDRVSLTALTWTIPAVFVPA